MTFNFTRRQREIADLIRAGHTPKSLVDHFVVSKSAITRQLSLMYMVAKVHRFEALRERLEQAES